VAVATTIATTYTSHWVGSHPGSNGLSPGALTHGFEIAFYALAGLAVLGAIISAVFVESAPSAPEAEARLVPALEDAA
jgi:hypothetical protein